MLTTFPHIDTYTNFQKTSPEIISTNCDMDLNMPISNNVVNMSHTNPVSKCSILALKIEICIDEERTILFC